MTVQFTMSFESDIHDDANFVINGEVIGKKQSGDQYLVEIRQHAENQDGELSIEGTATVALPTK